MILNPKWCAEMDLALAGPGHVTLTSSFTKAIQYLVVRATGLKRAYKVINNGAGVKTFTTETDICPCCKRRV
jgi:hypothetical protein